MMTIFLGETTMRRIVLAALLAAVAMPAWAMNDERPQLMDRCEYPRTEHDLEAYRRCLDALSAERSLCWRMEVNPQICVLRTAHSETHAFNVAEVFVRQCKEPGEQKNDICAGTRAYIKQRWGY